jgi:hypothetical protein
MCLLYIYVVFSMLYVMDISVMGSLCTVKEFLITFYSKLVTGYSVKVLAGEIKLLILIKLNFYYTAHEK